MSIDRKAYFERIDYHGAQEPTLDVLKALARQHAQAIPFENLDPLLHVPIGLDPASLERKLVHSGRGGYCFEHNLLLFDVLGQIGFDVTLLSARVLWNMASDALTMRSHSLLRVELAEGTFLADVGFGALTLTGVLKLGVTDPQSTPHEPFRLQPLDSGYYAVQAELEGAWKTLYRFDLARQYACDYEQASFYLCNHPSSHFQHNLMLARALPDGRYALRNRTLTRYGRQGVVERRELASRAQLRSALEGPFGIRLPEHPELSALLDRIASES